MTATSTLEATDVTDAPKGFQTRLPNTTLGRWSLWLAVAFVAMFVVNMGLVGVVGTSTDPGVQAFSQTYLPYWGFLLMGMGAAAGVVGLVAILKQRERSIVTLLTTIPAVFVLFFLVGELVFPH